MATTETSTKTKSSRSKPERKAKAAQSSNAVTDKLKTVVRRLPPNLPEDVFWQSVQPWVSDETVSWKFFYQGKIRKRYNKENVSSRAYIAFRKAEQLAIFSQAYDGHVFRDKAGNESYAVVEFAPHQKVPPEKKKVDPRNGTIEQDENFISFIASLNAPVSKPADSDALEALIAASHQPQEPRSTPLLEALKAEKQAQRDREIILKSHAHYQRDADATARRRGKQPQPHVPAQAERDVGGGASALGQGKRSRRGGGGKKGEASAPKDKEPASGPSKSPVKSQNKPPVPAAPAVAKDTSKEKDSGGSTVKDEQRERRVRPAFSLGGASRQFEAALTGAGVVPAGGAERRSRREREKDKKAATPAGGESSANPPPAPAGPAGGGADKDKGKDKDKPDKPQAPTSPNRERTRGGRKRGDSVKSPTRSTNPAENGPGITPTILTRTPGPPGIIQRPAGAANGETLGSLPPPTGGGRQGSSGGDGVGRGGRRRGGRGRGAPAGQAGRGGAPEGGA
ncbi:hypothetical protein M0805_000240 [Coniferiporia weirii]|nr:hypothetical protein M0805_000240 [Coniferiporia weirii]